MSKFETCSVQYTYFVTPPRGNFPHSRATVSEQMTAPSKIDATSYLAPLAPTSINVKDDFVGQPTLLPYEFRNDYYSGNAGDHAPKRGERIYDRPTEGEYHQSNSFI